MKHTILSTTLAFALASAKPQYGGGSLSEWHPAGPDDVRGPCPMLNTLANHGFLPHDGRNITEANAVDAFGTALNMNASFASEIWHAGVIVNPEPNATFFTLEQLSRHNVLEHDASMSRLDAYFGSNIAFNETIYNSTRRYWTDRTMNITMMTNGKLARQIESRAFNPTYTFSQRAQVFSVGEVSAFVLVFGDIPAATTNRDFLDYFFKNERLPTEVGWKKPATQFGEIEFTQIGNLISSAINLVTEKTNSTQASRRDLHMGQY